MPWVYVLKGSSGRHDIGSAVDLEAGFAQHLRGHTATTQRLGEKLKIVAKKRDENIGGGSRAGAHPESKEKSQARHLSSPAVEQPGKYSGLAPNAFGALPPGSFSIWRLALSAERSSVYNRFGPYVRS